MVSLSWPHFRQRRVRLQVSRVPHARHTVVLLVQSNGVSVNIHRSHSVHNARVTGGFRLRCLSRVYSRRFTLRQNRRALPSCAPSGTSPALAHGTPRATAPAYSSQSARTTPPAPRAACPTPAGSGFLLLPPAPSTHRRGRTARGTGCPPPRAGLPTTETRACARRDRPWASPGG